MVVPKLARVPLWCSSTMLLLLFPLPLCCLFTQFIALFQVWLEPLKPITKQVKSKYFKHKTYLSCYQWGHICVASCAGGWDLRFLALT